MSLRIDFKAFSSPPSLLPSFFFLNFPLGENKYCDLFYCHFHFCLGCQEARSRNHCLFGAVFLPQGRVSDSLERISLCNRVYK